MPAASTSSSGADTMDYTEEEKLIMLRLPRKEYLFTAAQAHSVRLTLVGLLFAYAYDARTTQLDQTPESAWTICSLIPVFAGLDPPPYTTTPPGLDPSASLRHDISTTLQASYRRALAYPLFRSWTLCEACRQDVARIFGSGKRQVVRALLDLKKTLDKNDIYYVYSKIWVDDMLVWVMIHFEYVISSLCLISCYDDCLHLLTNIHSEDGLSMLAQALKNTRVEKHSLGWKLDQLEATVRAVQTGEDGGDSDDEDVIPDSDDDDEV
jgi:protein SHQ1